MFFFEFFFGGGGGGGCFGDGLIRSFIEPLRRNSKNPMEYIGCIACGPFRSYYNVINQ